MSRWLTRTGEPTQPALEELDRLGDSFKKAIIVALPEGLSVLARDRHRGKHRIGMVQTQRGPLSLESGMPMASVLFPALIVQLLQDENISFGQLQRHALRFTHRWTSLEVKRVENPETWEPSEEQVLDLDRMHEAPSFQETGYFEAKWKEFEWTTALKHWKAAFSKFGIVTPSSKGEKKVLQLWRSTVEVDEYVCCSTPRREILQKVVTELGSFSSRGRREHKSCMFIATPGSGKTFLVRRLADTLGLRFLGFIITQMLSKSDILDCFDTIVTSQAQNRNEPLLVFIDEINAKLDGQHVYDTFLAPLDEHVYVRAGKTFHIEPCAWIFAGTEDPTHASHGSATHREKADKASDFVSRLSLGPLDLTAISPIQEENEVEKIYMGVAMLQATFPNVRRISKKVLQAFHSLPPDLEAREIRHFVESFLDIQYGEVRAKNIDREKLKKHLTNITLWSNEPELEEDMVEIQVRPSK